MEVELQRAAESARSVVEDLLQLYLHEFSEFDGSRAGADGRFAYPYLPLYWEETSRHPFLIRANNEVAGFALLRTRTPSPGLSITSLCEFFVLRELRRQGVGCAAFRQLLLLFPGPWSVEVRATNHVALDFWNRVIAEAAEGEIEIRNTGEGSNAVTEFTFVAAPEGGVSASVPAPRHLGRQRGSLKSGRASSR